ncbi:hypothetical protein ACTFIW_000626 [Dictyostelium discoideum]
MDQRFDSLLCSLRSNNKFINRIKPIIPPNMKKDHEVNIDYGNPKFQKEYFEWDYKRVNCDLSRTFAYRNIIAKLTCKVYCISESVLPNIISFGQFI